MSGAEPGDAAGAAKGAGSEGAAMYGLVEELFPVCRSITGDGMRQTLARISQELAEGGVELRVREVPSGTRVFDWTVPREWNVRDAWIEAPDGRRVVDLRESTLHVVSYSLPVDRTMSLEELRPHLHTLPEQPDWIPYRTSYYEEAWGFCLRQRTLDGLEEGEYRVRIDSTLADGHLTYGEAVLPGESGDEVLISCHSCHPSLANDNLSGIAVATALARRLAVVGRRHTFRFLFIPGTIGSITWLALERDAAGRVRHGLVLSCVGDRGGFTYKRSRRGDAVVDRAVAHVLGHAGTPHEVVDFTPYGYDERQYCSPGFDLPVGCFMRTPNGRYPEYHTSADDLDLVDPDSLQASLERLWDVTRVLEANRSYRSTNPHCEPQLGRRGLYRRTGGGAELPGYQMALLWVLNLSDGTHDLLEIADRAGLPFEVVKGAADALLENELLTVIA